MKSKILLPIIAFAIMLAACGKTDQPNDKEYLGNPDAKTELQIYSDIQCPACARASDLTDTLLEKFPEEVKISFYHFPLESIHPHAFGAAVAAECAGEQGKMWKYVKYAYKFQGQLDTQNLKKHAINLGLDTEKFDTCVDDQATAEIVKADLKRSLSLGLNSTPSFAINGEVVDFKTFEELLRLIEVAVEEAKSE